MYNQDIKGRFMWDCEDTIGRGSPAYNAYKRLFELSSGLEEKFGKDLAAFSSDEFIMFERLIAGNLRIAPMRYRASMLRYLDWCNSGRADINTSEGTAHILNELAEYKNTIVSGPVHLQVALDKIFDEESRHTIDVMYRCFLWMAFAGVRNKQFASAISVNDVDVGKRIFFYNGKEYPIYPQALEAFDLTKSSTAFVYEHPNYTCSRDRVKSDRFLRGIKADAGSDWIMLAVRKKTGEAHLRNPEAKRLSYQSTMHSGIFYRQYEAEAAGMDVDFTYLLNESAYQDRACFISRKSTINADLKDEYYVWKYLMYKDKV